MFILSLVVSFFFFFLLPVLVIPLFNEKLKRRFSALIFVNFIVLFALSYYVSLLANLAFLGEVICPIVWSFVAYFVLKSKLFPNPSES